MQSNRRSPYGRLPESVRGLVKESEKMKEARKGKVWIYRLQGRGIEEDDGVDLGMLQEDLHFEFVKDAATKPKEEVKVPEENSEEGDEGPLADYVEGRLPNVDRRHQARQARAERSRGG